MARFKSFEKFLNKLLFYYPIHSAGDEKEVGRGCASSFCSGSQAAGTCCRVVTPTPSPTICSCYLHQYIAFATSSMRCVWAAGPYSFMEGPKASSPIWLPSWVVLLVYVYICIQLGKTFVLRVLRKFLKLPALLRCAAVERQTSVADVRCPFVYKPHCTYNELKSKVAVVAEQQRSANFRVSYF